MIARLFLQLRIGMTSVAILWCVLLIGACNGDPDADGDGFVASEDCDDEDPRIRPSATEQCNAIDDDCDGDIDEAVLLHYQRDADGDGYGTDEEVMACRGTPNTATNTFDCDDSDPDVHPKAPEICANGEDEDCDGHDAARESWYADADGDGFGDPATTVEECGAPSGFIDDSSDCDDSDASVHPKAAEVCGNLKDDDCTGSDCLEISLSDADAEYTGEAAGDWAGFPTRAGDVNADGYADILVPTFWADAAYLVLGGPSPASASLSTADAKYTGEDWNAAGRSVAGAGDVDGDTYDDVLVGGAVFDGEAGTNAGAAYLVLGGPSPASISLSTADAKYTGEAAEDYAGGVAGAGDVDDDGFADFLVGAGYNDDGGTDAGALYLVLGGESPSSMSLSDADVEYTGAGGGTGAGDVDADGYSDILANGSGGVYLVLGGLSPASAPISSADALYTGGATWVAGGGDANGDGYSDVNGDGYSDILLGKLDDDDGGLDAGAAFLVLGSASPNSKSLVDADAQYTGEVAGDWAGYTVAAAGDVDADGYDEILVGAARTWVPGNPDLYLGSRDYLVLGGPSPASASLSDADVEYNGEAPLDFSYQVSGAGDVDDDGHDDVLVGAWCNDDGAGDAGAVYLLLRGGM